jgi:peptide/nickel transport system substrate-binding protein
VDPQAYMANWLCDDWPRPETQWQGANIQRFCMPEYDALVAEMAGTADLEERGRLAREMNDMIIQGYSIIPLIHRGGQSARAVTVEGVKMSDWDSELWNIAEWTRTPGAERE